VRFLKWSQLGAAALLLAGCNLKTLPTTPFPAVPAGQGVVVFSTGSYDKSYVQVITLDLQTVRAPSGRRIQNTDIQLNYAFSSSDFADEHGHVRVLALDEGDYCFNPRPLNIYFKLTGDVPHLAFRVKKGTVTYIGNLFMDGYVHFTVRNMQVRDLDRAYKSHPALKSERSAESLARIVLDCSAAS
jgi:hypothetical protein